MKREVVDEFVVPKGRGKGFMVKKGQVFRVICHEGEQVPDIIFFNAHNHHEQFSARYSALIASLEGTGGLKRIIRLYSQPPWDNLMLTVIDDPTGVHTIGAHCSRKFWELDPELNPLGGRTCSDNFADALAEFGIILEDKESVGVFNAFMNFDCDEDGTNYKIIPPVAKKGDYIDFLAEMDVVVGFSNCPDQNEVNNWKVKDIKVQIFE